jgi:MFS family permease
VDRISRGFRLLGASWEVLKQDRELLVLPVVSFALIVVAAAGVGGLGWAAGLFNHDQSTNSPLFYVFAFVFYFVTYSISIYFNAAVIGAAMIRLEGGDPGVADGLRVARSKLGKILGWAAVAATVGLVLRSLEDRAGIFGRIAIALIGAAWNAVTFFVVPVLLYEPVGVGEGLKRSARLFKERWGEQFTGNVGIGLAMFIVALPLVLVAVALGALAVWLGILFAVLAFGLLAAVGSALTGVFNAALYRYATTGESSGPFALDDLHGSFRPKRPGFFSSN